jgi:hypothetical protein
MTTPVPPSSRPWGPAAVTAAAIAVVLALLPFLQTVSTIAGTIVLDEPRYVGQILAVEAPRLVLVPLGVGVVAFLAFAAIVPIRGSLRMAQVVRRGFATGVVALVIAAIASAAAAVISLVLGAGPHGLSAGADRILSLLGHLVLDSGLGGLGSQLVVLLAVPLGALLLWGWVRRAVPAAEV